MELVSPGHILGVWDCLSLGQIRGKLPEGASRKQNAHDSSLHGFGRNFLRGKVEKTCLFYKQNSPQHKKRKRTAPDDKRNSFTTLRGWQTQKVSPASGRPVISLQCWGWMLQITNCRFPVFLGVSQIPVQNRFRWYSERERKKERTTTTTTKNSPGKEIGLPN